MLFRSLAPVVLFMRGVIRIGDTLVIEEPEAHLHPAAQTRMAVTLARLVRAGVRVLVTTHSDWLLKEIANLMREGALAEQTGTRKRESTLPSMLHPDEVGVWLFRQGRADQGSTVQEIPFDRSEGVEPPEYDDVAEQLYRQSRAGSIERVARGLNARDPRRPCGVDRGRCRLQSEAGMAGTIR